jgi:hypothetical protein
MNMSDIHSIHCCLRHGCRYDDENCTVLNGLYPTKHCEYCEMEPIYVTGNSTFNSPINTIKDLTQLERTRSDLEFFKNQNVELEESNYVDDRNTLAQHLYSTNLDYAEKSLQIAQEIAEWSIVSANIFMQELEKHK